MYQRILVPLDGSPLAEQVLPYVLMLARSLGSRVELLRLIAPLPPVGLTDPAREVYRQRIFAELREEAEGYLSQLAGRLRQSGLAVSTNVIHNVDPATGIINAGEQDPDTLIAMSSHGRSGLGRWVLGSVTDRVFRVTESALLVARVQDGLPATAEINLDTIILPLDGSPAAEEALPAAATLSKLLHLKVILVEIAPPGSDVAAATVPVSGDEPPQLDYLSGVEGRLLQMGASPVERRRLADDTAAGIVSLAQEASRSIVVMASQHRSGLERVVPGSVTDQVVRQAADPVLVVAPLVSDSSD